MNEKAWKEFLETGSIESFLEYKGLKKNEIEQIAGLEKETEL